MFELLDRMSREKIIFNIPDFPDSNEIDGIIVKSILSGIGVVIDVSKAIHLGKYRPKPRPIKITCNSKFDIGLVLKSEYRFRSTPDFQNI